MHIFINLQGQGGRKHANGYPWWKEYGYLGLEIKGHESKKQKIPIGGTCRYTSYRSYKSETKTWLALHELHVK